MGLTIRGDFKDSPSYDMGAASFYRLRKDIAYSISQEYGEHYEKLAQLNWYDDYNIDEYNRITDELVAKYGMKNRMLDFLYQSDVTGKLSPYKCKALLDQINSLQNDSLYGYAARPEYCMTMEKFKELLTQCFLHKKYLIWY